MAKGARASTRKRNNANLRAKVFGPAFDARTERLSAKLQELASAPKPEQEGRMDAEEEERKADRDVPTNTEAQDEAMQWTGLTNVSRSKKNKKPSGGIHKVTKRKAKNQVVFPSEIARKKRQAKSRKG